MEKQTKRDVKKMVEAKAKGKQTRRKVATDETRPESAEVDTRISKAQFLKKF